MTAYYRSKTDGSMWIRKGGIPGDRVFLHAADGSAELDLLEDWLLNDFEPIPSLPTPECPPDRQVGGDHYKKLGPMQPAAVLRAWLTPEEYRGWIKGNAIVYLARERDKGGDIDIEKAAHFLSFLGADNGRA